MTQDPVTVETNTAGTDRDGTSAPPLFVFEPRCKVCGSEHRAEIDEMLRRGSSQAEVRRYWNAVLGQEFFTPNNLSVHVRKHLYGSGLDDWVRRLAHAKKFLGDPPAIQPELKPETALRTVLKVGLDLIAAGVSVPESSDVIRAAKELHRIQREQEVEDTDEMMREIRGFMKAVKLHVPEEMFAVIYAEFEEILGR